MPVSAFQLVHCAFLFSIASNLYSQSSTPQDAVSASAPHGSWKLEYDENFENPAALFKANPPSWVPDTFQTADEYSDGGTHFKQLGVTPPIAFRAEGDFGENGWLTVAAYSRSNSTKLTDLFEVVPDPAEPRNHVLEISSPRHTDGIVVRPTSQLPGKYRVSLRVGFASFGNGKPGPASLNGYAGGETDEPWSNGDASLENGFYWLTILDATPRPHNNIWIHHHRKVTIDSDNNKESWTNIWEGKNWVADGQHPIMMFGINRNGDDNDSTGRPFLSWSHGALQPSGQIRAADAYKDNTWYSASIERNENSFVLTISGDFKWGGQQTYVATIPVSSVYQADAGIPDFFAFGDPHNNYYRGSVYYDDIKLEVWQDH
ncbi:MAG TPA: hypothetical protein VHU44_02905 [Acidobacteriaceae bacterium]|jgi:hypothetical protein|nr:hypothetical protein [Acidobacteriaceae bacterium]